MAVKLFVAEAGTAGPEDLRSRFEVFGNVVEVVPQNITMGKSYAFVVMEDEDEAQDAIDELNESEVLPGAISPMEVRLADRQDRKGFPPPATSASPDVSTSVPTATVVGEAPKPAEPSSPSAPKASAVAEQESTANWSKPGLPEIDNDIPPHTTSYRPAGIKVFIGGLSGDETEEKLVERIKDKVPDARPFDVKLFKGAKVGGSFVRFPTEAEAEAVISGLQGQNFGGTKASKVGRAPADLDEMPYKLFVTNIRGATPGKIRAIFEKYSEVKMVMMIVSKKLGRATGDAIVELGTRKDAVAAVEGLSKKYALVPECGQMRLEPCREMRDRDPHDPLVLAQDAIDAKIGKAPYNSSRSAPVPSHFEHRRGMSDRDYYPPPPEPTRPRPYDPRPVPSQPAFLPHSHPEPPRGGHSLAPPGGNCYIGNVPTTWGEDDFRVYFREFGEILSVKVYKDKETNVSKGFGFIAFSSALAADSAVKVMNGRTVQGNVLRCNIKG